jgi:phosphoribosylglycinamide formyltransferase 2
MQDGQELQKLVHELSPSFIIPEIEAIDTKTLIKLEQAGFVVIPTARATDLTMDREGIRRLAAEELGVKTADYRFATTFEQFEQAVEQIGIPCVVKPVRSSSGKGQSTIKQKDDIPVAWDYALTDSRGKSTKVIIEEFIQFDSEITLLTVRHRGQTSFCPPIGHRQQKGDYRESWQPHGMSAELLVKCQEMAQKVTENLGGKGLFGVEIFLKGDQAYFSEVSPRPHDTGLVTLISQNLSEFALHVRAILDLPIPEIKLTSPAASKVILGNKEADNYQIKGLTNALKTPDSDLKIFGKPSSRENRRLGVLLATGKSIAEALEKVSKMHEEVEVSEKNKKD